MDHMLQSARRGPRYLGSRLKLSTASANSSSTGRCTCHPVIRTEAEERLSDGFHLRAGHETTAQAPLAGQKPATERRPTRGSPVMRRLTVV